MFEQRLGAGENEREAFGRVDGLLHDVFGFAVEPGVGDADERARSELLEAPFDGRRRTADRAASPR